MTKKQQLLFDYLTVEGNYFKLFQVWFSLFG